MIRLRAMKMKDAVQMLKWKNYPETRKFAIISHGIIKKENHLVWLEKNIQWFHIITVNRKNCGAIRVQNSEVSIWIDRKARGKGLATKVIKLVSKKGFTAKIVFGNVASMRAFIKAGYLPIGYAENYYILQK